MKTSPLILLFILCSFSSVAQDGENQLKVFIDCKWCDEDFIKQEMTSLSYVRDRLLADVHVQLLSQNTGSGGDMYTFFFFGQNELKGINDTLTMSTDMNNTRDEIRRKQIRTMELGLVKYMIKKGYEDQISLTYLGGDAEATELAEDKWNNWVFRVNANGNFSGEKQYDNFGVSGGFNIDRVTEKWKIESGLWTNYRRGNYYFEDTTVVNIQKSTWIDVSAVRSISDHFSLGLFTSSFSSIFNNYQVNLTATPAIEYNFFPYSESTQRQIRVVYKVGVRHNEYHEETIYNRTEETLLFQDLGIAAEFQEKWGSINGSVTGSHYFHNVDINRVNFRLGLNLRLFKGFSWRISGNLALIHDQISLPLGDASEEDILLSQRQLQTGYRFWANTGFSYTFGSIYNSVVNPRFGD
ncbi:MAG: hypothetical protein P8P74_07840 [Crocinitomicaceae bacterium]|nr:hypothetical protein [Crocinitomicaceae bacterium]